MNMLPQTSSVMNPGANPATTRSTARSQSMEAALEMQRHFAQKMRQCAGGAVVGAGAGASFSPIPVVNFDKFRDYMASIFPDCDVGRGQEVSDDEQSSESDSD